jgi:DNA-binding response OmpR family regulator
MTNGVLVVQDDKQLEHFVCRRARGRGWQTYSAASMREAWALIASRRVRLVLVDVFSRRMDSIDLIRRIQFAGLSIRVVLASPRPGFLVRPLAQYLGVREHVVLNSGPRDLCGDLEDILQREQKEAAVPSAYEAPADAVLEAMGA